MPVDGHPWCSREEGGAPEDVGTRRVRPDPLDGGGEVSNLEGTDRRPTDVELKLSGDAVKDWMVQDPLPVGVYQGPMCGVDAVM